MKSVIQFLQSPQQFLYLLPLCFIFLLVSCEKEMLPQAETEAADLHFETSKAKPEKTNTFYGPAKPFATGVARAFVTMNHSGEPTEIGITFSERMLDNLPHHMEEFTLELPNKTAGLAFDHIDLGWNPSGHEPPGVYDLPHFDMHFYMITPQEKMQITDPDKAEILPSPEYWPENYVPTPGFVPMMGKHWLNLLSNEAQGKTFDQTFIYGSYNGEFIFYEPMITVDYLKKRSDATYTIFQPAQFQRTGFYYPTSYSINYDEIRKIYTVKLGGMVLR